MPQGRTWTNRTQAARVRVQSSPMVLPFWMLRVIAACTGAWRFDRAPEPDLVGCRGDIGEGNQGTPLRSPHCCVPVNAGQSVMGIIADTGGPPRLHISGPWGVRQRGRVQGDLG